MEKLKIGLYSVTNVIKDLTIDTNIVIYLVDNWNFQSYKVNTKAH